MWGYGAAGAGGMKAFSLACTLIAVFVIAVMIAFPFRDGGPQPVPEEKSAERAPASIPANIPEWPPVANVPASGILSESEHTPVADQERVAVNVPVEDNFPDSMPLRPDLSYLADYVYSEVPPDTKPADTILAALQNIPPGAPIDEIKLACEVLGLNVSFMKAVAKIESGFDPKQRTGSYIGLFQLSHYEFDKYGSGDIVDLRDNSVAAAYKFITAAILFELSTHKKPTLTDLYLIHQQGVQGAAEHVAHPERIAWKSMCATDEGRQKGEKWCKRAVWQNTLPAIKQIWKSVDNMTSGAFVAMWQQRVDTFYAHYAEALAQK